LFGKTAAMALAGKAVLIATAGALGYKLWYFPNFEIMAAINKGTATNNYAWLRWVLHANQGNTAFFTTKLSCSCCDFTGTPREYAFQQSDLIAQALIDFAFKNPSAVSAAATAANKQKDKQ